MLGGKYRIIELAGRGGMSNVYRAVHERLQKEWAVKEIRKENCRDFHMFRRRLIAEADMLKKLKHPGLPGIIDIIEEDDAVYIIMDFIHGKTLKELVRERGVFSEEETVSIMVQICQVLEYLHCQDPPVIYRDLKPSNLMIEDGCVKLIDFGTAREYSYGKNDGDTVSLGTRGYAAPEQYGGRGQTDARTDIYCLGVTIFFLLTGASPDQPPYRLCPVREINPWLSEGIEEILLRCVQDDPDQRFQSCREVIRALEHVTEFGAEYRGRERRKIYGFLFLMILGLLSGISSFISAGQASEEKNILVKRYVERAERAVKDKDAEKYWIEAINTAPACRYVYDRLVSFYAETNHFTMENAARLISIMEEPVSGMPAIEYFRKKNKEGGADINYKVGLAFFYDMGGIAGKREAEGWFRQAVKMGTFLKKGKKRRAAIYEKICRCYRTFLIDGADRSGEKSTEGYSDFFLALQELNHFSLNEKSAASDIAAAYMISVEVAMDIRTYAEDIVREGASTCAVLREELERIREGTGEEAEGRIRIFRKYKSREEVSRLADILDDALEKIDLIEKKGGRRHDQLYGLQNGLCLRGYEERFLRLRGDEQYFLCLSDYGVGISGCRDCGVFYE